MKNITCLKLELEAKCKQLNEMIFDCTNGITPLSSQETMANLLKMKIELDVLLLVLRRVEQLEKRHE